MSLKTLAAEREPEMIALRRKIHANPETAFKEFETTALIKETLQGLGIETRSNGDSTGVVGILKGAKPGPDQGKTIGLRADIDALPTAEETGLPFASTRENTSHACGHDIHTAAVLGAAMLLSGLKEDLCGTVKFIFQPAEEPLLGARNMIANGVLENPKMDYILCGHTWPEIPGGTVGVRVGAMLASADRFKITVTGKGGHAAHPHKCVDTVVVGAAIVTQLQTIVARELPPYEAGVVSIGRLAAGVTANVIPEQAEIEGAVRAVSYETRERMKASLTRIATHTALGLNAKAEVEFFPGSPPTLCDAFVVSQVSEVVTELLGADKLLEIPYSSMGSEDFAEYLQSVPGALLRLGTMDGREESRAALHNPRLVFDEQAIVTGAMAFTGAVFKLTGSDFGKLL